MQNTSSLPLEGVRVLDLSRVFAGPLCTMALGDLGAEIIKVEHPVRGDDTRDWGLHVDATRTTYFNSANRNKRSITLDLQTTAGQDIARQLAAQCDVVVQNFKFGGAEKLRLGYEDLKAIRSDIVYCSISGYNRSGPEAARPGYDLVLQAETGLMNMNGEATQPPLKFGTSVVDMLTGMYASQAILASLYHRRESGQGRHIEMALFDSGISITAFYGLESLWRGEDVPRYGNDHPSIIPYGLFDAQDGTVVIAVGNNAQFARFCTDVIARPEIKDDARFSSNAQRSKNRQELLPIIRQEIASRKRGDLLERLRAVGIPCGEVLGLYDALTSERAIQGQMIDSFPVPDQTRAHVIAPPYRLDGQRTPVRHAPPSLGEGTQDVLQSMLGLSSNALATLRDDGVI